MTETDLITRLRAQVNVAFAKRLHDHLPDFPVDHYGRGLRDMAEDVIALLAALPAEPETPIDILTGLPITDPLCPRCNAVTGEWTPTALWMDALDHPATNECPDQECMVCGIRDCPEREPLHYHHDGCPCCSQRAEPETPKTCATCRHLTRQRLPNDEWEAWCAKLIGLELDSTPDTFHCSLHQPHEEPR
jgi:hypothetical protein